jgi:protein TonB
MALSVHYKLRDGLPLGTTVLKIHIDEAGKTQRVVMLKSSGKPELDEATIKSVWSVNYRPYLDGGKPVPVTVVAPISLR